jgi:hypothetical protein
MNVAGFQRGLLFGLLALVFAGALFAADRLETTDGDILVGTFEKLEGGNVHFTAKSVGAVTIPVEKVRSLRLDGEREGRFRTGDDVKQQQDATLLSRDGKLVVRTAAGDMVVDNLSALRGVNEAMPDERPRWEVSGLGTFAWTEGNTRTYTLGYRFDVKRTTKHNFQHLFARGNYMQDRDLDRDPVRERRHHIGYLYRYIFPYRLTVDLTQDLYFNELAGYRMRSITGFGPGYYIHQEEKLWWHVAAHVTYTYEDQIGGAEDRSYWGARARTEVDWVTMEDRFHLNFKSEVLFDFDEFRNVNFNNALLLEYKINAYFSAGLLVEHYFDNLPPPGFSQHDFRLTLTLGVSWSGRWI